MQARILFTLAALILAACGQNSTEYPPAGSSAFLNDRAVLQYTLVLEQVLNSFYQTQLSQFTPQEFNSLTNSSFAADYVQTFADYTLETAQVLFQGVEAYGASPLSGCNYTFEVSSVEEFLQTAIALHDAVAAAAIGAIPFTTSFDLRLIDVELALSNAEAAAVLSQLVNPPNLVLRNATGVTQPSDAITFLNSYQNNACESLTSLSPLKNSSALIAPVASNATFQNDNSVLEVLLFLEELQLELYETGLAQFSNATLAQVGMVNTLSYLRSQDLAHAYALQAKLQSRGVSLNGSCSIRAIQFNDSVAGFYQFLTYLTELKTVAVDIEAATARLFTDASLLVWETQYATVQVSQLAEIEFVIENRNPAYVKSNSSDASDSGDDAYNRTALLSLISQFVDVSSCSSEINLPVTAITFVNHQNNSSSSSSSSNGSSGATGAGAADNGSASVFSETRNAGDSQETSSSNSGFGAADNDSSASAMIFSALFAVVAAIIVF